MSAISAVDRYDMTRILEGVVPKHKESGPKTVAIGVSIAVHVAIGAYVCTQAFDLHPFKLPDDTPIQMTMEPWIDDKPPPPPPPSKSIPRVVEVHQPPVAVVEPVVDPLPVPPQPLQQLAAIETTPALSQIPIFVAPTPSPPQDAGPPAPPAPRVIRDPTWLRKPTAEEMDRLYPERAARLGLKGSATLLCEVAASGTIRDCSVVAETPRDVGFAKAALASAQLFKLNPRTVDGEAVEGAKVRIPIVFNVKG